MRTPQKTEPQGNQSDGVDKEVGALRATLDELKAENEQLRESIAELTASKAVSETILRAEGRSAWWLVKLGMRFTVGAGLHDSIYALIRAWRSESRLPDLELADVITAVIRRWLRVGLFTMVGGIVATASIGLLLWQNVLIQEQIAQQAQISNTSRRAELIATIYDRRECDAGNIEDCPPRASSRARAEAAIAFVKLERAGNPGSDPDLAEADLSDGNLQNVNFANVKLNGANLQDAFLYRANLQDAFLGRANLQGADLVLASLQGAIMEEANLERAGLSNANLEGTILNRASLQDAFLYRANLQDAYLIEANLQGADLDEANLQGAYLDGANLQGADLSRANLQDAGTENVWWGDGPAEANLQGANLSRANLQGANLSRANLEDAALNDSLFDNNTLWPVGFKPRLAGARHVGDIPNGH